MLNFIILLEIMASPLPIQRIWFIFVYKTETETESERIKKSEMHLRAFYAVPLLCMLCVISHISDFLIAYLLFFHIQFIFCCCCLFVCVCVCVCFQCFVHRKCALMFVLIKWLIWLECIVNCTIYIWEDKCWACFFLFFSFSFLLREIFSSAFNTTYEIRIVNVKFKCPNDVMRTAASLLSSHIMFPTKTAPNRKWLYLKRLIRVITSWNP